MTLHYLCVRIGAQWYGIDLRNVIEMVHLVALTEVPRTQPHLLGLLTLREHIMPVIDMRIFFKLDDTSLSLNTPMVALRDAHNLPIVLVVDEVEEVLATDAPIQDQTETPAISGAIQLPDRMMMLLDIEYLVAIYDNVE